MPQTQAELLALAEQVLVKNYRQQPIVLERGRGCEVWDVAGNRYLDMTAGIAVCGLGHGHSGFTARVTEQLLKLVHVSNLYFNDQQILAAKAIVDHSFARRVFFCNSGGEANEGALKLARRYQAVVAGAPQRTTFVSTHGSFHGRSFGTVSITGQGKYRENFGPMVGPVEFIAYGDLEAATRVLEARTACAMIVEPIQAEGGIVVAPPGYLAGLRRLCDDTGTLLIFDEVQTGVGRTGRWFGHQHDEVAPDVMTLAKGLAGGIPIGAVACSEKAAQGLAVQAGGAVPHASTFGGNPLACAAAVAMLDIIEAEGLLDRVQQAGQYLAGKLSELVEEFPGHAIAVRGRGLLRGLAVAGQPAQVVARCREKGMLLSVAGDKVVRFAPPYIVERRHLDEAVAILRGVLADGAGKA
jgi:predicted acetylornithine/succinylornithine family transaminase